MTNTTDTKTIKDIRRLLKFRRHPLLNKDDTRRMFYPHVYRHNSRTYLFITYERQPDRTHCARLWVIDLLTPDGVDPITSYPVDDNRFLTITDAMLVAEHYVPTLHLD